MFIERHVYYVSREEYLLSQLEKNRIHIGSIDISDFNNVCDTAVKIADALDNKSLLHRSRSDAVFSASKKPFIFCKMVEMQYYILSFNTVAELVSEYKKFGRIYPFITMVCDGFTEERTDTRTCEKRVRKRAFGLVPYRPDELMVLGKIVWDKNWAWIQPLIVY